MGHRKNLKPSVSFAPLYNRFLKVKGLPASENRYKTPPPPHAGQAFAIVSKRQINCVDQATGKLSEFGLNLPGAKQTAKIS